jgi:hypothetical protein
MVCTPNHVLEGLIRRLELGEEKRNAWGYLEGKPKRNKPLKNIGVGRRIILKWTLENGIYVDWINMTQDREKMTCFVKTVMNIGVP